VKLSFNEVLEALADERRVSADQVSARALDRTVWVAEWHLPGCMSESWAIYTTKADAVRAGVDFSDGSQDGVNRYPRGIVRALRKHGYFQHRTELFGTVVTTVEKRALHEMLS